MPWTYSRLSRAKFFNPECVCPKKEGFQAWHNSDADKDMAFYTQLPHTSFLEPIWLRPAYCVPFPPFPMPLSSLIKRKESCHGEPNSGLLLPPRNTRASKNRLGREGEYKAFFKPGSICLFVFIKCKGRMNCVVGCSVRIILHDRSLCKVWFIPQNFRDLRTILYQNFFYSHLLMCAFNDHYNKMHKFEPYLILATSKISLYSHFIWRFVSNSIFIFNV